MLDPNVHPIADEALGNTSYLVDVGDGRAVSIDPRRDVAEHLELASRLGLRIVAVLETHLHADFVSGSREIASVTGAEVVASKEAGLAFAHRGVEPSNRLDFGRGSIEVLATPGHTPEHLAYVLRNGEHRGVFSGGSLIAGGAARTDLTGPDRTDELTRAQYASIRMLSSLPEDTVLYPTHGAGSFCSTGPVSSSLSTIGDERERNPLLAARSEGEFVEAMQSVFGSYPRYFAYLRGVNRLGASLLPTLPEVRNVSADDARKAAGSGAWVIDGRSVEHWARAHASNSVSIELRPAFASWLGWVVPFSEPIVLILEPGQLDEALGLSRRVGYDRIEGWLTFDSWRDAGFPVSSVDELDVERAAQQAAAGSVLLDVRQASEFASRHIEGASHLELGDIIAGKAPAASQVITYCGHGERSATAASLLARRGIRVANLRGGTSAWRAAGYSFEP